MHKPFYGLKQSQCAWHDKIAMFLGIINFQIVDANHYVYVHKSDKGIGVITIYVDDLWLS